MDPRCFLVLLLSSVFASAQTTQVFQGPEIPAPGPSEVQKKCILRETGPNGEKVCVCNSTYCDTAPSPQKVERPSFVLYFSNKEGVRFEKINGRFSKLQDLDRGIENVERNRTKRFERKIYVNSKKKFQKVIGWGGAFTDSTGINIKDLDQSAQDLLMKSYFSDDGIEYNLCRVPIGGTDFSTHSYTYDDSDTPDPDLKNFNLTDADYDYKIPFMQQALKLRKNKLKFFGSTWGAPAWMKTNNETSGYGFLKKEYYQTWADYFVKFLKAYKENGLDFWAVTTQNEATLAFLNIKNINTVGWNTENLGNWTMNNLGPTINASFPNTEIIILDDQKLLLPWAVNSILENPKTLDYVKGIAIHWYMGLMTPCAAMNKTHYLYPKLYLLSTEACSGFQESSGVHLGSWERGEEYSTDIIEDMSCWVAGWVDWNMVLDPHGGPTYINNTVDSPIIVNKTSGEFYKQPMYYNLGHFSKFVPEGSVRIELKTNLGWNLMSIAFKRPDGAIVVVILNKNNEDKIVKIIDESVGVASLKVTKRSINTFLYW